MDDIKNQAKFRYCNEAPVPGATVLHDAGPLERQDDGPPSCRCRACGVTLPISYLTATKHNVVTEIGAGFDEEAAS